MSKTTAIVVACLSLGMYAMAQKGDASAESNQPVSAQLQNESMVQPNQQAASSELLTASAIGSR